MIRRFWRGMIGLWVTGCGFSLISWLYLYTDHIPQSKLTSASLLLTLPTGFPTLWSLVNPSHGVRASAVILVLVFQLVQVALTGGLYGTLARLNTGQTANASSFAVDAGRAFPRLFIWTLLWFIVQSILVTQGAGSSASAALSVSIVMLLARFLFLFAQVALVCEGQASFYAALGSGLRTLVQNIWRMIPVAAVLAILTGIAIAMSSQSSALITLIVSLLYSIAAIWILHMLTSRYLAFSKWQSRVQ